MIKIKWSEKSVIDVMNNIRRVKLNSKAGAKKALRNVAENIMAQSRSEVPIDTGTLQSSGYIESPIDTGRSVIIKMGYGGPKDRANPDTGKMASEYALVVHETPSTPPGGGAYHPYGKWKFLEDPVRVHSSQFLSELGKELRIYFAPGIRVR